MPVEVIAKARQTVSPGYMLALHGAGFEPTTVMNVGLVMSNNRNRHVRFFLMGITSNPKTHE